MVLLWQQHFYLERRAFEWASVVVQLSLLSHLLLLPTFKLTLKTTTIVSDFLNKRQANMTKSNDISWEVHAVGESAIAQKAIGILNRFL